MKDTPFLLTGLDAAMYKMVRLMWGPFVMMGLLIVFYALLVGFSNSADTAQYLSSSKIVRESAESGSLLVNLKVSIESVKAWLPPLKFFGMGLLFAGITMALANIILTLRNAGVVLQREIGIAPVLPKKPWTAYAFPMLMMLGLTILAIAAVEGFALANVAADFWNHSIKTQLDTAESGSLLLGQLQAIEGTKAWLEPFKFVGVATLLTGIALALYTIRYTLRVQSAMMLNLVKRPEN
ncbi:hypothetical protein HYS79_02240 [Patescibacteria group bacterium]|nr:hypothetical protein [Patescibacteria group bacterium]